MAKRLGRSRQWLDSVLGGAAAGAEVCLRVARQERLSPLDLLRAEGHDELADELHAAGFDSSTQVSSDDRAVLAAYHSLPDDQRHHFRALLESVAHAAAPSAPPHAAKSTRRRR